MTDPRYCVTNLQADGDLFVNGPFDTREAAYAWALEFGTEQAAIYSDDTKRYLASNDDGEVVWVHPEGDEDDVEIELTLTVRLCLSPNT